MSPAGDGKVLSVLAEDVQTDPGGVEVVRMTGVVARLVAGHAPDAQGGAGGGGRVLDLDHARPRHQLAVVLPHHVLGAHDGGADDALQLQRAVLLHVDVWAPEYPHLHTKYELNSGENGPSHLGHHHQQLHPPAHLGHGADLALVGPGVPGGDILYLDNEKE